MRRREGIWGPRRELGRLVPRPHSYGEVKATISRLAAMLRRIRIGVVPAAAAILLAVAVVGCGESSGEKIPPDDAQSMLSTAAEIDAAFKAGDCELAESETTELRRQVDELPESTDQEIVDGLNEMVSRLDDQLSDECAETGTTDTTTTETTVPPATTTTVPPPAPEEEAEDEGNGNGPPEQPPGEGGGPGGVGPPGQQDGDDDAATGGTEGGD